MKNFTTSAGVFLSPLGYTVNKIVIFDGGAFLATSLDGQHSRTRAALGLPKDFVLHSLGHTFLTWLGEAGVDAFTIMRIATQHHNSFSEEVCSPSSEAMERAFERLETFNAGVDPKRTVEPETVERSTLPATVSAALPERISSSVT